MKDSAFASDTFFGEWRYILDGKEFSSLNAIHYLTSLGFSGRDALLYMRSLREEIKMEGCKK